MSAPSRRSSRLASRKAAQRIHQQFKSPWDPIRYHPCDTRTTATKYEREDTGYKAGGQLYTDKKKTSRPRGRPRKNQILEEEEGVTHVWNTYIVPKREMSVPREETAGRSAQPSAVAAAAAARKEPLKLERQLTTSAADQAQRNVQNPPLNPATDTVAPSSCPVLNPLGFQWPAPNSNLTSPPASDIQSVSSRSSESTSGPSVRLFSSPYQPTQQPFSPCAPISTMSHRPTSSQFDLSGSPTRAVPGILETTYSKHRTESSISSFLPTASQDFRYWMNQNLPPSASELEDAEAHLVDRPTRTSVVRGARAAFENGNIVRADEHRLNDQRKVIQDIDGIKQDVSEIIRMLLDVQEGLKNLSCQ